MVKSFFELYLVVPPIANICILLNTFLDIFVLKQVFEGLIINNILLFRMVDNKRLSIKYKVNEDGLSRGLPIYELFL